MSPASCESVIDGITTSESIVGVGEERHFGTTTVKGTVKGFLPSRPSGRGVPITYMDEIQHDAMTDEKPPQPDNYMIIKSPAGDSWKITAVSVKEAEELRAKHAPKK